MNYDPLRSFAVFIPHLLKHSRTIYRLLLSRIWLENKKDVKLYESILILTSIFQGTFLLGYLLYFLEFIAIAIEIQVLLFMSK